MSTEIISHLFPNWLVFLSCLVNQRRALLNFAEWPNKTVQNQVMSSSFFKGAFTLWSWPKNVKYTLSFLRLNRKIQNQNNGFNDFFLVKVLIRHPNNVVCWDKHTDDAILISWELKVAYKGLKEWKEGQEFLNCTQKCRSEQWRHDYDAWIKLRCEESCFRHCIKQIIITFFSQLCCKSE